MMDSDDLALFALLATAYVARLRAGSRPPFLIGAYVRVVRALRSSGGGVTTTSVRLAILALGAAIARYVAAQVPTAPAFNPYGVGGQVFEALLRAGARAERETEHRARAVRLAIIVAGQTQLATATLTEHAVQAGAVRTITRTGNGAHPCPECAALAGTYTAPFPDTLYWSHPHCACSWSEG